MSEFQLADHIRDGKYYLGGQWRAGQTSDVIEVFDPSTGSVLASVPDGGPADVEAALDAAEAGLVEWRRISAADRAALLYRWSQLLRERASVIAEIEAREVGYAVFGSAHLADAVAFMAGEADKIYGRSMPTKADDTFVFTIREPLGVCVSIVPWNAPTALMMTSVAPALAAGNTMVVKPSEEAPLACLYVASLAVEAGLPAGVLNVVTGFGSSAGAALVTNPRTRHVSFTGSAATGALVAASAARNVVPVHLELGGKTPHVVRADADLDLAIPSIVSNLVRNAGQICYAGTRAVVHASIAEQAAARLRDAMAAVRVGSWRMNPDMGPLISKRRKDEVLEFIDIGRREGGEVLFGGHEAVVDGAEAGNFVQPTLIGSVTSDMAVAREEIFGPVLSLMEFTDDDQAAEIANATPYGLAASVWTDDVNAALRLSSRLDCGQIWINSFGTRALIGAPFGGFKQSGYGRIGSVDTVLDYTQAKTIVIDAAARPPRDK